MKCYKKFNKIIKYNKNLQDKLSSGFPNVHTETDFLNATQE